jgi:hypothetical protein
MQGASQLGYQLGQDIGELLFGGGRSQSQEAAEAARQKALEQMRQALQKFQTMDAACRDRIRAMNAAEKADEERARRKASIRDDLLAELGKKPGRSDRPDLSGGYVDSNGRSCPGSAAPEALICPKGRACLCESNTVRVRLRGGRTACLYTASDWSRLALDIEGADQKPFCGLYGRPAQALSGGWACRPLPCHRAKSGSSARSLLDQRLSALAAKGPSVPGGDLARQIQEAQRSLADCRGDLAEIQNDEAKAAASRERRRKKKASDELLAEMGGPEVGDAPSAAPSGSGAEDSPAFSWQTTASPDSAVSRPTPQPAAAPSVRGHPGRRALKFILPRGPIYQAARSGSAAQIAELLRQGQDPNQAGAGGVTPLMAAAYANQPAAASALVAAGARVDLTDHKGRTPLMYAAAGRRTGAARRLLALGAGVNIQDQVGMTALDYAIMAGSAQLARLLLAAGADESLRDDDGLTALDLARETPSRPEIVGILESSETAKAEAPPPSLPISDMDSPAFRYPRRPNDWALVVGIESYRSLPRADFAKRDAEAAGRYFAALGVPGGNIISLLDSAATLSGLSSYLEDYLPKNVGSKSRVYFYFSGHGAPDPRSRSAYLVPWDAVPEFIRDQGFPVDRLYADLARLHAERTLVVMDACFSGAGARSVMAKGVRPLVVTRIGGVPLGPRMAALAAAKGTEIAAVSKVHGHGLLTYYFLKGLNLKPRRVRNLYDFIKPRVEKAARRQNDIQDPVLEGADIGLR